MPLKDLQVLCQFFSEQHKKLRQTRIERDVVDTKKLIDWFTDHSPFDVDKKKVTNLFFGLVGSDHIDTKHMRKDVKQ